MKLCREIEAGLGVHFENKEHTIIERQNIQEGMEQIMTRKLVIEGSAVYEIDEECMLKRRLDKKDQTENETDKTAEERTDKRR